MADIKKITLNNTAYDIVAKSADYTSGFTAKRTDNWPGRCGVPGTFVTGWMTSDNAEIAFNNENGHLHTSTDGFFWQGVDVWGDCQHRCLDTHDSGGNALITSGNIGSQSVNYASSAGSASSATNANYATSAGNADTTDNNHLGANVVGYAASLSSGGWAALQGRSSGNKLTVAYNSSEASWNSGTYSSSIVFGAADTKGLLDCAYNKPIVTFGGSSVAGSTDDNPTWYMKITGSSTATYDLNKIRVSGYDQTASSHALTWTNNGTTYSYNVVTV